MPSLISTITREQLKKIVPDQRALKAFEELIAQISSLQPNTIDGVSLTAERALAATNQIQASLDRIASALELLALAPASVSQRIEDNLSPTNYIGSNYDSYS